MPFNSKNYYSLVSQVIRTPLIKTQINAAKNSHLTPEETKLIIRLHKAGSRQKDIAHQLGRDSATIGACLRRQGVPSRKRAASHAV